MELVEVGQPVVVTVEIEEVLVDDFVAVVVLAIEDLGPEGRPVKVLVVTVLEPVPAVGIGVVVVDQRVRPHRGVLVVLQAVRQSVVVGVPVEVVGGDVVVLVVVGQSVVVCIEGPVVLVD